MRTDSDNLTAPVVPPGAPRWVTSDLLADTMRVWGRHYRDLTPDDAVAIIGNVGRLYDVLRSCNEELCCSCAC